MSARTVSLLCLAILVEPLAAGDPLAKSVKFDDLKPLLATLPKAAKVILHEGLPHPHTQTAQYESEMKTKKTVKVAGWPFYAEPLALKDGDETRLIEILTGETTFGPYSGPSRCGGFHPDYAVEWQVGEATYYALLCFGCNEVKVYGPGGGSVLAKIGARKKGDRDPLASLLQSYRKNRPDGR